jgi:hypothetical protein
MPSYVGIIAEKVKKNAPTNAHKYLGDKSVKKRE